MAEWLVEEGIGEHRAIRIEGGDIAEARVHWPGGLVAGQVEDAKLVVRRAGTPRGAALFASGERAHVDGLAASTTEGSTIRLEVTRTKIWEAGRTKLAQCRPTEQAPRAALGLAAQLRAEGNVARVVRRFPDEAAWPELWSEVDSQQVEFASGSLRFFPTPAMLLVDVDGDDDPAALARSAVAPLARTLRRWDIGGNIGIDFPTIDSKAARRQVDDALSRALADWPHERTAMNGFGFVQIVSRLERPSFLGRIWHDRAGAKARALLREAEGLAGPGDILVSCVDWVAKAMKPEWIAELGRRTGRRVRLEIDPDRLDIEACFTQLVPR